MSDEHDRKRDELVEAVKEGIKEGIAECDKRREQASGNNWGCAGQALAVGLTAFTLPSQLSESVEWWQKDGAEYLKVADQIIPPYPAPDPDQRFAFFDHQAVLPPDYSTVITDQYTQSTTTTPDPHYT